MSAVDPASPKVDLTSSALESAVKPDLPTVEPNLVAVDFVGPKKPPVEPVVV